MNRRNWIVTLLLLLPWWASASGHEKAKESYVKKANQELQEWNAKVDDLQKRSEKAGAWTREELEKALSAVRQSLGIFQQKVIDVQGSGDGWTHLRKSADDAFRDVKHTYREATSSLDKNKHKEKP
jgi:hypothetical protein